YGIFHMGSTMIVLFAPGVLSIDVGPLQGRRVHMGRRCTRPPDASALHVGCSRDESTTTSGPRPTHLQSRINVRRKERQTRDGGAKSARRAFEHDRQGYLSTSGRHRTMQWHLRHARCPHVPYQEGRVVSPAETSVNTPPAVR